MGEKRKREREAASTEAAPSAASAEASVRAAAQATVERREAVSDPGRPAADDAFVRER